jgi:hypothetical protein
VTSERDVLIGCATPAPREAPAIGPNGIAAILRRQLRRHVAGQHDRKTRSDFVERAGRSDLAGLSGIDLIGIYKTPRGESRAPCEVNQVQAVVIAQLQRRDQQFRRPGPETRPRVEEVPFGSDIQEGTRGFEISRQCGREHEV